MALHHGEELAGQLLQVVGREVDVLQRAVFLLDGVHLLVEGLVGDAQRDLAEELDEAPVGVPGEARVGGLLDQALQRGLVEAQVEDGVHHARHRHRRAGAHRHQQRILGAAEALAGLLLQRLHVRLDVVHQPIRQPVVLQIGEAGLGGDGEAGRHVEADLRHLAQIGALAAKQHLVLAVAFLEFVDELAGFHVAPWV
jgi:hypothetical protein